MNFQVSKIWRLGLRGFGFSGYSLASQGTKTRGGVGFGSGSSFSLVQMEACMHSTYRLMLPWPVFMQLLRGALRHAKPYDSEEWP